MKHCGRKCFGGFLIVAIGYVTLTGVAQLLVKKSNPSESHENAQWVASSKSWVDRQLCRWFGVCGTLHLRQKNWTWQVEDDLPPSVPPWKDFWNSDEEDPDSWSDEEKKLRDIPQYVFDYAPYVHLFSGEKFWPCDLGEHLVRTSPQINYTTILDLDYDKNLTTLHELNDYEKAVHGRFMYLKSDDNVEERPEWLGGAKNIPKLPAIKLPVDEDEEWPEHDEERKLGLESVSPQSRLDDGQVREAGLFDGSNLPWTFLTPSENGRCGGNSGFTCKGSKFGKCCSIYGWCGRSDEFCGQACDILAGDCKDPFEPDPKPRSDLRRRHSKDLISKRQHRPDPAGKSSAPALLIVVPKDDGVVDAFWFFFYSFNEGNKVFNIRFGNHIGDWEHTLIRFKHGQPVEVALSEHDFGCAYAWHALEKYLPNPDGSETMIGTWSNHSAARLARRPVVYSAVGTHAMYPTPALQPYILPWGLLHDQTDRGPLWDPSLNAHSYTWDYKEKKLRASTRNPKSPTGWFHFAGHWGDKYYRLSDPRQYRFAGEYHYVNGPTGPRFKNLQRQHVCQGKQRCHIKQWVDDRRIIKLPPSEDSEPGGLPGGNSTDDDI